MSALLRYCLRRVAYLRKDGVEADGELMLENDRSIREGLWRLAQFVQDAAESLNLRIEEEDLDGSAEAIEGREAQERLQALSSEVSEEVDAYTSSGTAANERLSADRRRSERGVS